YARHPEAMSVWGELYSRLPRTRFRGGWEHTGDASASERYLYLLGGDERHAVSAGALHADSRDVILWDMSSGRPRKTLVGTREDLHCAHVSADGRYALAGGGDYQ